MILFEDKDIIVCHKPAGIPVQSARLGQKDMVSILNNHLAEQSQKMTDFVHVVHRLDQPVEGVIVFAKNQKAAANLTKQMQQDNVKKVYQAVCCAVDKSTESEKSGENCGKLFGNQKNSGKSVQANTGEGAEENCDALKSEKIQDKKRKNQKNHLEDFLVKDGRTNTSRIARKGEKDAKLAVLDYEVLAEKDNYKLVQVYLKTGRHHQIRVQMAHAGLPLYGDQKYNERWEEFAVPEAIKTGLALCAVSYSFKHPTTGKQMKFEVKPGNPVFEIVRK